MPLSATTLANFDYSDSNDFPAVYYYPGKSGTLRHFGHVAIALNEDNYLTYGEEYREVLTLENGEKQETRVYSSEPFKIILPALSSRFDAFRFVTNWQKDFKGEEYNIFTHNCAHSVVSCLEKLGYPGIPILKNTRPSTIAAHTCKIRLKALQLERSNILVSHSENPLLRTLQLIENDLQRLKTEVMLETVGGHHPPDLADEKKADSSKLHRAAEIMGFEPDISQKQIKIQQLKALKESLFQDDADFLEKLKNASKTLGGRTAENLTQCVNIYKANKKTKEAFNIIKLNNLHKNLSLRLQKMSNALQNLPNNKQSQFNFNHLLETFNRKILEKLIAAKNLSFEQKIQLIESQHADFRTLLNATSVVLTTLVADPSGERILLPNDIQRIIQGTLDAIHTKKVEWPNAALTHMRQTIETIKNENPKNFMITRKIDFLLNGYKPITQDMPVLSEHKSTSKPLSSTADLKHSERKEEEHELKEPTRARASAISAKEEPDESLVSSISAMLPKASKDRLGKTFDDSEILKKLNEGITDDSLKWQLTHQGKDALGDYQVIQKGSDAKKSFNVYLDKLTSKDDDPETFKAMLKSFFTLHTPGGLLPQIKTSPSLEEKWKTALTSLFNEDPNLSKLVKIEKIKIHVVPTRQSPQAQKEIDHNPLSPAPGHR